MVYIMSFLCVSLKKTVLSFFKSILYFFTYLINMQKTIICFLASEISVPQTQVVYA